MSSLLVILPAGLVSSQIEVLETQGGGAVMIEDEGATLEIENQGETLMILQDLDFQGRTLGSPSSSGGFSERGMQGQCTAQVSGSRITNYPGFAECAGLSDLQFISEAIVGHRQGESGFLEPVARGEAADRQLAEEVVASAVAANGVGEQLAEVSR